jgi:hypothetical protein
MTTVDCPIKLVAYEPGSNIELDDPLTGARRLVRVCDTGTEFVDYVDWEHPATPLAILDCLDPVLVGNDADWSLALLESGDIPKWQAYLELLGQLFATDVGGNSLARARAGYYAYKSGDYDLERAVAAGLKADAEARARMADISAKAELLLATGAV